MFQNSYLGCCTRWPGVVLCGPRCVGSTEKLEKDPMASPPDIPIELFWREAKGKKAPRRRPCSGAARRRRHLGQGMEWTGDRMDRVWTLTPLEMKEEVSRLSPEFLACASRWNGWHFEMRTLSTMGCWGGKGLNCRYQPPIPTWLASPHTLWLHRAGGRA